MNEPVKKLAGVIGWPVSQSLSPALHGYWIAGYGLAAEFLALGVAPADFANTIRGLPAKGFAGVSVTIPHKEAAHALSDTLDEDAQAAGAVNLLLFADGKVHGRNTDAYGFSAALEESLGKDAARRGPVVVLGAGGAARAVVVALLKGGAKDIRIVNRTKTRAEALIDVLPGAEGVSAAGWDELSGLLGGASLLVNTTSLGMTGKEPLRISLDQLPGTAAVADIVYNPLETALLHDAKARGHRVMDGLGMLMHQAVPAFEAWFGVRPEVTPALRALLEGKLRG